MLRSLEASGIRVLAASRYRILVEADAAKLGAYFLSRILVSADSTVFFAVRPTIPRSLRPYVDCLILDKPAKSLLNLGPNTPVDPTFVDDHITGNYSYGNNYHPLVGPSGESIRHLLLPEDILKVLNLEALPNTADPSIGRGAGVTAYLIDTGVSLDCPWFKANPSIASRVEWRSCVPAPAGTAQAPRDWIGHGTMCACGFLMCAPNANLVMYSNELESLQANGLPTKGSISTTTFLSALDGILLSVMSDPSKASIVSLSNMFLPGNFMLEPSPDQAYAEFVSQIRLYIKHLYAFGVPVFAATGNEDSDLAGVPGQMPEVIGVGGAFPATLLPGGKNKWQVSNFSMSGKSTDPALVPVPGAYPEYARQFPTVCGVEGSNYKPTVVTAVLNNIYPKVLLCLPVSRGATPEQLDDFDEQFPVPQAFVDAYCAALPGPFCEMGAGLAWGYSLLSLRPLDNNYSQLSIDTSDPTDGWIIAPGGTSFATPLVAGVVATVFSLSSILGFSMRWLIMERGLSITNFKGLLMASCYDVTSGKTAKGDEADKGPDVASGGGVIRADLLLKYIAVLSKFLIGLSTLDQS